MENFIGLTFKHRIIHIVAFEFLALLFITPLASFLLNEHFMHMLSLAITGSLIASSWNFIFNYLVDIAEVKYGGNRLKRGMFLRSIHSLLFQGTLMILMVPTITLFLHSTLVEAFIVDLGFLLFFTIYSGVYNYLFDCILFNVIKAHLKN